ncbi:MAG: GNAT family N-acetyltransferase [Candidatus Rokubacteria bacterium]|nr:GNAT family N-acetyltransferase [Candidatus Rokubacteria bacterium]
MSLTEQAEGVTLHVPGELTVRVAPAYARAFEQYLDAGVPGIRIDLEDVKTVDAVGLAAVLQSTELGRERGLPVEVLPGTTTYHALIEARLVERIRLVEERLSRPRPDDWLSAADPADEQTAFVAETPEFGLRIPSWGDLRLFEEWAADPVLQRMVGSELLYRCRHLGAYHPVLVGEVLHHPTSLTVLVESTRRNGGPMGFMRLYGIHLAEGFAFLEVAIASKEALRRGWGVAASRLLVAYGWDALGLRRIEAKVYAYNRLSINALRRNGFEQEGVLRKAALADGLHWDVLVFSILEEAMREQRERERFPSMRLWRR